jgi:hypothetical protein
MQHRSLIVATAVLSGLAPGAAAVDVQIIPADCFGSGTTIFDIRLQSGTQETVNPPAQPASFTRAMGNVETGGSYVDDLFSSPVPTLVFDAASSLDAIANSSGIFVTGSYDVFLSGTLQDVFGTMVTAMQGLVFEVTEDTPFEFVTTGMFVRNVNVFFSAVSGEIDGDILRAGSYQLNILNQVSLDIPDVLQDTNLHDEGTITLTVPAPGAAGLLLLGLVGSRRGRHRGDDRGTK